ncbi:MAG TPA: response regulator, partial [Vicinamibacterales bacterium]|nr:response regulator [Vicinamibacterales bacterium]
MAANTHAAADPAQNGHAVPRLLLIEGEQGDRPSIRGVLEAAHDMLHIEHVTTVKEGVARLLAAPFSAVLLDLTLPESRELTAVDELRRVAPKVAIMIFAPAADQALARRAVDRGANDCVITDQIDTRSLVQLIAMMFERRAIEEQKFVERERAEVTLNSIGDAVMTTDTQGHVTYLNAEAEALTGWTRAEAFARPLAEVFD